MSQRPSPLPVYQTPTSASAGGSFDHPHVNAVPVGSPPSYTARTSMSSLGFDGHRHDSRESSSGGSLIPTIDVKVGDYYQVADGALYTAHFFVLTVRVENLTFNVDRSYVDFVDLDRRLRKKFPRTEMPGLPLDAAPAIERVLTAKERSEKRKSYGPGTRDSFNLRDSLNLRESVSLGMSSLSSLSSVDALAGINSSLKSLKVRDSNELIRTKVSALDNYITTLLSLHELVVSDEMMLFLDEEASSMAIDPASLVPLTIHDLLLANEATNKRNVSRTYEQTFQVRAGQFVVWKFSTINYDIGFSVELNGEVKVPFTRYKSHEESVCGALEANQSAFCKLKWDNSYAKLRTKPLTYSAKVANPEDYYTAKTQALDVQREKKKFEDQRFALRRSAHRHASLLSGVTMGASAVLNEHAHEEKKKVQGLEEELWRLRGEIQDIQVDIENAQLELEDMETAKLQAEEAREQMQGSWRFTLEQLEAAQEENKTLKTSIKEAERNGNALAAKLTKAEQELKDYESRELELTDACQQALEQSDQEILQAKQQAKKEVDQLQQRVASLTQDNAALQAKCEEITHEYTSKHREAQVTLNSLIEKNTELLDQCERQSEAIVSQRKQIEQELKVIHSKELKEATDRAEAAAASMREAVENSRKQTAELSSQLSEAQQRLDKEVSAGRAALDTLRRQHAEELVSAVSAAVVAATKETNGKQEQAFLAIRAQLEEDHAAQIRAVETDIAARMQAEHATAMAGTVESHRMEIITAVQRSEKSLQQEHAAAIDLLHRELEDVKQQNQQLQQRAPSIGDVITPSVAVHAPSVTFGDANEEARLKTYYEGLLRKSENGRKELKSRCEDLEIEKGFLERELDQKSALIARLTDDVDRSSFLSDDDDDVGIDGTMPKTPRQFLFGIVGGSDRLSPELDGSDDSRLTRSRNYNEGALSPSKSSANTLIKSNRSAGSGDALEYELEHEVQLLQGQLQAVMRELDASKRKLEEKEVFLEIVTRELMLVKRQLATARSVVAKLEEPMKEALVFLLNTPSSPIGSENGHGRQASQRKGSNSVNSSPSR